MWKHSLPCKVDCVKCLKHVVLEHRTKYTYLNTPGVLPRRWTSWGYSSILESWPLEELFIYWAFFRYEPEEFMDIFMWYVFTALHARSWWQKDLTAPVESHIIFSILTALKATERKDTKWKSKLSSPSFKPSTIMILTPRKLFEGGFFIQLFSGSFEESSCI